MRRCTYVEHAVGNAAVRAEGVGVDEEAGNEVDAAGAGDLGVLGELGLPAILRRARAKGTLFAREGRGKGAAVVLELVGVLGEVGNVFADGSGVVRRGAGQYAGRTRIELDYYCDVVEDVRVRHIKRDEKLEVSA